MVYKLQAKFRIFIVNKVELAHKKMPPEYGWR